MSFWSGEKLAQELPKLIQPFDPNAIDCASYVLHLGEQAFVTKDDLINGDPATVTTQVLHSGPPSHTVCINTGQFAFLLTEETITVPNYALALINMKTKLKFKGLVNVSGFHVDPGFSNKLIFGVYNAGAQPIFLERGQALAMIVYADLDQPTTKVYKGPANKRMGIDIGLIQDMTGQVFSPMMLQRQMSDLQSTQREIVMELAGIKSRASFVDSAFYALVAILAASIFSLMAFDFVKSTIGGLMKSSIDFYEERIIKEVDSMAAPKPPLLKPSSAAPNNVQPGSKSAPREGPPKGASGTNATRS